MSRTGETEPIGVGPKVQQGQDVREGLDNGPHQKLEQQCTFRLITIVRYSHRLAPQKLGKHLEKVGEVPHTLLKSERTIGESATLSALTTSFTLQLRRAGTEILYEVGPVLLQKKDTLHTRIPRFQVETSSG